MYLLTRFLSEPLYAGAILLALLLIFLVKKESFTFTGSDCFNSEDPIDSTPFEEWSQYDLDTVVKLPARDKYHCFKSDNLRLWAKRNPVNPITRERLPLSVLEKFREDEATLEKMEWNLSGVQDSIQDLYFDDVYDTLDVDLFSTWFRDEYQEIAKRYPEVYRIYLQRRNLPLYNQKAKELYDLAQELSNVIRIKLGKPVDTIYEYEDIDEDVFV
jgi:hypothetical protein